MDMTKKVVLAGGSGNLGQLLTDRLIAAGFSVTVLTRSQRESHRAELTYVQWSGQAIGDWKDCLEGAEVLINLSGEEINQRLTEENKRNLQASRVLPTQALAQAVLSLALPPRLWINFSGVALFGGLDGVHDETSERYAPGFFSQLVQDWEAAFWEEDLLETRRVVLRLSPVLQREGGMFRELYLLSKYGLGGTVGDGQQLVSWIHYEDLLRIVLWIIYLEEPKDVYHASSPLILTNAAFMGTLREVVSMPFGLPLPTPLAKIGAWFKGVDDSLLLDSTGVISKYLAEEGFQFKFPMAKRAFIDLVKKTN